jgi:hypothetical protein
VESVKVYAQNGNNGKKTVKQVQAVYCGGAHKPQHCKYEIVCKFYND